MFTLFLCVALCADEPAGIQKEIPQQVREYFERADKVWDDQLKSHQDRERAFRDALRNEVSEAYRPMRRVGLVNAVRSLDEFQKTKPLVPMLGNPVVGDIGYFEEAIVVDVIDTQSVLVHVTSLQFGRDMQVVVPGPSTKSLKVGQKIKSRDVWRVTALPSKEDKAYKVEPVKKAELEKYRAQYKAGKKQNATPPAGIKDEKPELDKAPMPDKPKGNASEK